MFYRIQRLQAIDLRHRLCVDQELNIIFQLAYVAWPVIVLQLLDLIRTQLQGLLVQPLGNPVCEKFN
jgi:hypothetical protein